MCAIKTLKSVGNEEPWTENEVVNTVQQQEREEEAVKTIFNCPEQKYGPAGKQMLMATLQTKFYSHLLEGLHLYCTNLIQVFLPPLIFD